MPRAALLLSAIVHRAVAATAGPPERKLLAHLKEEEGALLFAVDCGAPAAPAGGGLMAVPDQLVVRLAEVLAGGPGLDTERSATPLERRLVARHLTAALAPVAQSLTDMGVRRLALTPVEPDDLEASAELIGVPIELTITRTDGEEIQGCLQLALPLSLFGAPNRPGSEAPVPDPTLAAVLSNVPVSLSVRFAPVQVPASELEELAVGDLIRLDHGVSEPLVAEVDGHQLFRVSPGRRGRRLALAVEEVLEDLKEFSFTADPFAPME